MEEERHEERLEVFSDVACVVTVAPALLRSVDEILTVLVESSVWAGRRAGRQEGRQVSYMRTDTEAPLELLLLLSTCRFELVGGESGQGLKGGG